ncbi:actin-7-related [Anaeramoeba ignava]|uniref:Actin-7-related n=1 Tax=Anaeramoeba ignava TaxID=1746090 RepID=A0A9Q0R4I7_ANAIG|nr:actin-7-related [Anaeramoeba ignava]
MEKENLYYEESNFPIEQENPNQIGTLVIQNGTSAIKAGFGGDDAPRTSFPAIIGKSQQKNIMIGMGIREYFVGDEAEAKRGVLKLTYPIENGIVKNWENMEKIWHHTFYNELRALPEENQILLIDTPLTPLKQREKTCEIFFETYNTPKLFISMNSLLSLIANGKTTGTILQSGHGVTTCVPISEGFINKNSILRSNLAGKVLVDYLNDLLTESGFFFSNSADFETIKDSKEKLCYVALDFESELNKSIENSQINVDYALPDGENIVFGDCRFRCPELMFKPHLFGLDDILPFHEMVYKSIMKCPIHSRKDLFSSIILSGGSTKFSGLKERITNEISRLVPNSVKIQVFDPPERKYSTWIGGSILVSLSNFQKFWVSKKEYEEYDSRTLLSKFI